MPVIAVDAMAGGSAPQAAVEGVAEISRDTEIECILVGDEERIQTTLEKLRYDPEGIDIVHTPELIAGREDPRLAVHRKRRASVLVAARLVAEGRADAMVTAGNTGAAVLACQRYFTVLPGIRTTALASVYPRRVEYSGQDDLALLLDVGATLHCNADALVQFALMGAAYARRVSKVAVPRVALLNSAADPGAGDPLLAEAYGKLRQLAGIEFAGNIEGHELLGGRADVIVCEGLLGNVVLKLLAGLGSVLGGLATSAAQKHWRWKLGLAMLSGGVGQLRELGDYASYGGAPVLGFDHLLIKAHGDAGARAMGNAIKVAAKACRDGVIDEIRRAVVSIA